MKKPLDKKKKVAILKIKGDSIMKGYIFTECINCGEKNYTNKQALKCGKTELPTIYCAHCNKMFCDNCFLEHAYNRKKLAFDKMLTPFKLEGKGKIMEQYRWIRVKDSKGREGWALVKEVY